MLGSTVTIKTVDAVVRSMLGSKIDTLMRRAAVVVAGNKYLADRAHRAGAKRVEIIPSVIDFDRYSSGLVAGTKGPGRHNPVVIGWIGTPITAHYLTGIEHALRAVASERSIELRIVGAPAPTELAGLPVKSLAWCEATEIAEIRSFDIGIMPLDDTAWERGKCAYKLLQVMAAGRPVVASPVGVNSVVIKNGINGFLADTPEKWTEAFITLVDDPDLRARMGLEALRTIKSGYTIERVLPKLISILTQTPQRRD